ncbi:MAG: hypothetical protein ACXWVS_05570 [Hyphomicrobium sp.]
MNHETNDQERRLNEFEARWEKEFGPQLSPLRKRLTGLFMIAAFLAIIALAFLSAPSP